jgi:hypothetical protein
MPGEQRRSRHGRDVLLAFDHHDPYVGQGGRDVDCKPPAGCKGLSSCAHRIEA